MSETNGFPVEFSPSIGAIAAALAKAQGEMRDAAKDAVNPHFKNRYSTLAAVREAVREPFAKNALAVSQYFEPHGLDAVCIKTLLMHSSGEWIRSTLVLPVSKKDAQGFGSAVSYGRRYQLAAIAGIASDEDDDANTATGKPVDRQAPTAAPPAPASVDVDALEASLRSAKDTKSLAEASVAIGKVKDKLSTSDLKRLRATLEEMARNLANDEAAQ